MVIKIPYAHSTTLKTYFINTSQFPSIIFSEKIRIGIQDPEGTPVGDILYLHGFGDRLDNHGPLFDTWSNAGFRVISFDYPSHGETEGTSINLITFRRLAELAQTVERATRQDLQRPLLLAGWSTGGLLAIRMVQSLTFKSFERKPKGLILFAPGISVYTVVGKPSFRYPLGEITTDSLTHDPVPPHRGDIKPKSPGSTPFFGATIKLNSFLSQIQSFPRNLPTLIFVAGGKDDQYANSDALKSWIAKQKADPLINIFGVDVPGARHEIDNETSEYGGPSTRIISADFAKNVLTNTPEKTVFELSPCKLLLNR